MSPCPRKGDPSILFDLTECQVQIPHKNAKESPCSFPFQPLGPPEVSPAHDKDAQAATQLLHISTAIPPPSQCPSQYSPCTNSTGLTSNLSGDWNREQNRILCRLRSLSLTSGLSSGLLLGTRKLLSHGFLPCKAYFVKYSQKIKIWLEKWSFI